jgi:hypothetical protein
MQKNVAGQKVVVYAYDDITGDAKTGDNSNLSGTVSKDTGSFSSAGGSFAEIALGYYSYSPTTAETNCDVFLLSTVSTTANVLLDGVIVYTTQVDAIKTDTAAVLVDTGTTLNDKIDVIDGIADAILVDTGTTLDGKINTIDGIVDAILVDTATTLNDKIDVIDGIVDAILVDTATTLDDKIDSLVAGSHLSIDGKTHLETLKIIAAVLAGQVSGAGTGTETFLGLDGSTTRLTATVDSKGNRTSISYA